MVSSNSLIPLIWVVTLGSVVRAMPFTWDASNSCAKVKHGKTFRIPFFPSTRMWSFKVFQGFYLLLQILHAVYLIVFLLFLEHPKIDLYGVSLMLFCFLFGISAQVHFFMYPTNELLSLINSFLNLDLKMRKNIKCTNYYK